MTLDAFLEILSGAAVTLALTLVSFPLVVVTSFVAGLLSEAPYRVVRGIVVLYIEVFRGTSLIVQLFYFYYVLPLLGIMLEPVETAILTFMLHFGAYGAEIVRAAIRSVPKGQSEAAFVLGMPNAMVMRRVILPQAAISMIPPLGNTLIDVLKASSLLSLITIAELTFKGNALIPVVGNAATVLGIVLGLYFVMAFGLTNLMRLLERHLGISRGEEVMP